MLVRLKSLDRCVDRLYQSIVRPVDQQLLSFAFSPDPSQADQDALLKMWDIEVAGAGKAMSLSYVQKAHPELDFGFYTGPRLAGLFNRNRFANLKLIAHYTKIGRALNAEGIRPLIMKGGAMKFLRPEHPRNMGDIDVLIRGEGDYLRSCDIIEGLGYEWTLDVAHSRDFHEKGSEAGVMDVHQWLGFCKEGDAEFVESLFGRAEIRKVFGVETYLPSLEDLMFIAIANTGNNLRENTSSASVINALFDVSWLARAKPNFDWGRVYADIRETKTEFVFMLGSHFLDRVVPGILPVEALDAAKLGKAFIAFCNQLCFDRFWHHDVQWHCKTLRFAKIFSSWAYCKDYVKSELYHQLLKHIDEKPRLVAAFLACFEKGVDDAR